MFKCLLIVFFFVSENMHRSGNNVWHKIIFGESFNFKLKKPRFPFNLQRSQNFRFEFQAAVANGTVFPKF